MKVLPISKALKLYTTLSSTSTTKLLRFDVQIEDGQMYDDMRRSCETFQRNVNKLTLNVKRKKFMHSGQLTLHDMFNNKL